MVPRSSLLWGSTVVIFGQKNQVIFGQNHLIIVQAVDKYIRARDFSPPELNSSRTLMTAILKVVVSRTMTTTCNNKHKEYSNDEDNSNNNNNNHHYHNHGLSSSW